MKKISTGTQASGIKVDTGVKAGFISYSQLLKLLGGSGSVGFGGTTDKFGVTTAL